MKRRRGIKLGRRLVRVWQWAVPRRTRRRPSRYLRLDPGAEPLAKSYLPKPPVRVVTDRLLHWGRRIALRLRRSGSRVVGNRKLRDEAPVPLREEGGRGCARPPKGHLAVYVGTEPEGGPSRRYLVPVIYFNHPLFGELLREAEQEFGFHHPGGITIPCAAAEFERVRRRIASDDGEKLRRRCATSI